MQGARGSKRVRHVDFALQFGKQTSIPSTTLIVLRQETSQIVSELKQLISSPVQHIVIRSLLLCCLEAASKYVSASAFNVRLKV